MLLVPKPDTRLNIRIKPEIKADLQKIAEYYGLTFSSYVHSLIVKTVRKEKESLPELFEKEVKGELSPHGNPLPIYEPGKKDRKVA